ncbi:MAG: hypothetical protein R6V01_02315 [Thermoplasmatota archaeon]
MAKVFLDTSVILDKVLNFSKDASNVFENEELELHTNEYVLKEIYHVLKKKFDFTENQIGHVIDLVRETCRIHPMPSKEELRSIKLSGRADRPMVLTARKYGLILYIDDERTYREASEYVEVVKIDKDGK